VDAGRARRASGHRGRADALDHLDDALEHVGPVVANATMFGLFLDA
jgi:hypothetical protein